MPKKIALLHRFPKETIKETNAAFPYLQSKGIHVITFKKFNRLNSIQKLFKSVLWIFYAPLLVIGKGFDVIYCDDSFPFYPALVKIASPKSKVVIRLGDLHLMYYVSGFAFKFLHFFERMVWKMADEIVAISEPMAKYIYQETRKYPAVILDPVEPKDFPSNGGAAGNIVMFHGLITRNKNIDILLEAATKLPLFDFLIVGDGPDKDRLLKKKPRNVHFVGWIPFKHIPAYIATCSVGVALRSSNPANEYVVTSPFLQYGVMGKPCLVTRREVFGDYPWQFSNVDELVDKIRILLKRPQHEGKKLQEFILKNHSAKKIAEEIWSLLSS